VQVRIAIAIATTRRRDPGGVGRLWARRTAAGVVVVGCWLARRRRAPRGAPRPIHIRAARLRSRLPVPASSYYYPPPTATGPGGPRRGGRAPTPHPHAAAAVEVGVGCHGPV